MKVAYDAHNAKSGKGDGGSAPAAKKAKTK